MNTNPLYGDNWPFPRSYTAIHQWLRYHWTKTGVCEFCGQLERRTTWSNKDHKYKLVVEDWQELCDKCHRGYDLRVFGIPKGLGRPRKSTLPTT